MHQHCVYWFTVGIELVDAEPFFTYSDGMSAWWVKENTHILYGEDGSLDNNCSIVSGRAHVYSFLGQHEHENTLISGITFGRTLSLRWLTQEVETLLSEIVSFE